MSGLPPSAYQGQVLCPRCGRDSEGRYFASCAETADDGVRYSHDEACGHDNYGDEGLCAECEKDVFA